MPADLWGTLSREAAEESPLWGASLLPADEREAFDLVRVQGLSHPEAADVLGVAVKTVKRRLDRGLRLLTERLGDLRPGAGVPGP